MKFLSLLTAFALMMLFSFGCNSSKDTSNGNVSDIPGKVLVLLDQSVQPQKLERDFESYELKNQGQISRSEYRFSYSYNTTKVSAEKLIQEINAKSYASEAAIAQQVKD